MDLKYFICWLSDQQNEHLFQVHARKHNIEHVNIQNTLHTKREFKIKCENRELWTFLVKMRFFFVFDNRPLSGLIIISPNEYCIRTRARMQ